MSDFLRLVVDGPDFGPEQPGGNKFLLTEQHLKMIGKLNINTLADADGETTEVDPKRPYGNSSYLYDIFETLTGTRWDFDELDDMPTSLGNRLEDFHVEVSTAIKVVLNARSVETGLYVKNGTYAYRWRKA